MTPQQTFESDNESWSLVDWMQTNTRVLGIGAAIVAVAAVGYWFYMRSAEIKRLNAERGLNQAKQSAAAGNIPLAQSDLQRVASRYAGTQAGAQAALILAGMRFDEGKFADGLKILEPYQNASNAGPSLSPVWSLTGDGWLLSAKLDQAVDAYQKAADASPYPGQKAVYRAQAARAYMAAGKNAEAKALWEKLASDPSAISVHNEAQIRLGELSAAPAGKS
jgi:tetratricopeptide (TPR) repeat protein